MENRFIVKVQLAIISTDPNVGVLVYNEDHSIFKELPVRSKKDLKELEKEMRKGDHSWIYNYKKNYFYAELDGKGGLILTGVAPWQQW